MNVHFTLNKELQYCSESPAGAVIYNSALKIIKTSIQKIAENIKWRNILIKF